VKRPQGFDPPKDKPRPQKAPTVATPATVTPIRQASPTVGLRAAMRERRSYEREEVRRFTRRSRSRKRAVRGVILTVVLFCTLIGVAVFSPLLALQKITVVGASRVDPAAIHDALDGQLGTPLALVDFNQITDKLAAFPLIRSYTTESVPPHTLVVTIVERQPIGVVDNGTDFAVIDPAGVVIESAAARVVGLPLISAGQPSIGNPAFASAVEVLLALPPELLSRVDTISATTKDDVSFVLAGDVQSVTWGSADRSAYKARVLAALVATQSATARLEYDISAPDAPVVRSR
jgi:cell division protein FtsQ